MNITILTLFPEFFNGPFNVSMLKRARDMGLLHIRIENIRDYARGKHSQVDDRPYGGGPGMVLKPEPLVAAIRKVRTDNSRVVFLSPQGKPFQSRIAKELVTYEHLILLCGHYEGIDQRVLEEIDIELSVGDFVLTSGCPAAVLVVDAVARFIPGVLGHPLSAKRDSFEEKGYLGAPKYTRPAVFEGKKVPSVLLSGDHKKIDEWNEQQSYEKTKRIRPELLLGEITATKS